MQFEFDIYDYDDNWYSTQYFSGATVQLLEKNNNYNPSRKYYISRRSVSKKIVHFTAYDIPTSKLEQKFIVPDMSDWNEKKMQVSSVFDRIKEQCGFESLGFSSGTIPTFYLTEEQLTNKTVRQVLEMTGTAACGVWGADGNGLAFGFFGGYDNSRTAKQYTEIDFQGKQKITKLFFTSSETGEIKEFSSGSSGTVITIDTPFAEPAEAVWEAIGGYEYVGWHCKKFTMNSPELELPSLFTEIDFGGQKLVISSYTISVDSTGVYYSGGADPQSDEEWKYIDAVQREISERVKIGNTVGNVQIGQDSIKFVNKNTGSDGKITTEKYGFEVGKGVVKSAAALIDKIMPTVKMIGNKFTLNYNGTGIGYEIIWDDDDNFTITEIAETEVSE